MLSFLVFLTLVFAFLLPPVASYVAVYGAMLGLLILSIVAVRKRSADLFQPAIICLLLALALILAATLLSGPAEPGNWQAPGLFTLPLLCAGLSIAPSILPSWSTAERLAGLALGGVLLGLGAGLVEVVWGTERAGAGNNPIHYSGLMVLLGFGSLAGFAASHQRWRYVYLAGPVAGAAGALLSGSRGPFLAVLVLVALIAPVLLAWNWRDRLFAVTTLALSATLVLVLAISPLGPRALGGLVELVAGAGGGNLSVVDEGRTQMLNGALGAFADSPIWGHGWTGMMQAAERHFPPDSAYLGFDNLHSDPANFAAMGGVLALAAYGLLLVAPWFALLRVAPEHQRPALLLAIIACFGPLSLGFTNAFFGILPQTMVYTALLGWLVMLQQKETGSAALDAGAVRGKNTLGG